MATKVDELDAQVAEALKNVDELQAARDKEARAPKPPVCKFFNTKEGCRNGERCRYHHTAPEPPWKKSRPWILKDKAGIVAEPASSQSRK